MAADQLNDETEGRRKLGGIGHTKYCELISTGALKSLKIGRRRFVSDAAIGEFIAAGEAAAAGDSEAAEAA